MSESEVKLIPIPTDEAQGFGRYRLIAKLGEGGMADVFLATSAGKEGFRKLVVIKRLKHHVATDPEYRRMFRDEARLASRLNHANVVQTYEVDEFSGKQFLVMEFLDGQPLNHVFRRCNQRRNAAVFVRIALDVLCGLEYAHQLTDYSGKPLEIVHRDVSPHNIFVTFDGVAKLVDFGIAKASTQTGATITGIVKGKMSYMAPEQALCSAVDKRADIFSAGIVLWELLAGQRFWGNLTDVQIMKNMTFGEMPRLRDVRPDLPEELDAICARALDAVPTERYPTAGMMRQDLEEFARKNGFLATASDVSALMTCHFEDVRKQVRTAISEHLAAQPSDPRSTVPEIRVQLPGTLPPPPLNADGQSVGSARTEPALPQSNEATPPTTTTETGASEVVRPPRRRNLKPVVIGFLLAVCLGVLLLKRIGANTATTQSTQATTQIPAAPKLIRIRIQAAPATAKVLLDDVEAPSNPFDAKFTGDGSAHRIRVMADGYAPFSKFLIYDKDQEVDVSLEALPEAASSASATPATTATATATPTATASTKKLLPKKPGGKLQIDTTYPGAK